MAKTRHSNTLANHKTVADLKLGLSPALALARERLRKDAAGEPQE